MASVRRDQSYRSEEEVEKWKKRDPIEVLKTNMMNQSLITQEEFDQLESKEKKAVEIAVDFARKSPFPAPEELYDDLFTDPIEYA